MEQQSNIESIVRYLCQSLELRDTQKLESTLNEIMHENCKLGEYVRNHIMPLLKRANRC